MSGAENTFVPSIEQDQQVGCVCVADALFDCADRLVMRAFSHGYTSMYCAKKVMHHNPHQGFTLLYPIGSTNSAQKRNRFVNGAIFLAQSTFLTEAPSCKSILLSFNASEHTLRSSE